MGVAKDEKGQNDILFMGGENLPDLRKDIYPAYGRMGVQAQDKP